MDACEIVGSAPGRIEEHRTAEAELRFVDAAGAPLAGAEARVRLVRHELKLGCNAFRVGSLGDAGLQQAYNDRFAALLNYATLPFYWGRYEPEKDRTSKEQLEAMAGWCAEHCVATKGHPLVWHEVFPQWANELDDATVLARLEARVRRIVAHFRGKVGIWDVVNEATVSHRFANTVGRWIAQHGAAACVGKALAWAHEANPQATLLYNDFNVSDDFEALAAALKDSGAPLGALGVQSHMHKAHWPLERAWQVCETYARFGLPLHFTELTILSGRFKAPDDNDWHERREDWSTTPEGEARQLEYGQQFYTVLFSHPAIEAITWWDFTDRGSWQGAPAGLVRQDMSPKPLYDWLMDAFHRRWATDTTVGTDANGAATVRCFFGDHEVEAVLASGAGLRGRFTVARGGPRRLEVALTGEGA